MTATGSPLTVQLITATSVPWEKVTSWLTPGRTRRHHDALSISLWRPDGPLETRGSWRLQYVSKFIDQFAKWTVVYLLCTKDQAPESLQLFVTSTVIPFGSRIVTWRADTVGEYTGEDLKAYCQETGITQQLAATNTPQQTGISERVGRTVYAMVRYMHVENGLPSFVWWELMMAASYICNRIPLSALNTETSYKKLYGKYANLSHLKTIDARTFVHIKDPNKLGHTSWEGMVCGFHEAENNSYRIWNPKTRRVVENRNVIFIETRDQTALAATRSQVTVVRFQRRHTRRQLRLVRRHTPGRAEPHLRSGFWRRHACRNGRIFSTSTNLTQRNVARGSLACGNFSRGSYTGWIITSTSAHASPGAGARARTRTRVYTCFCGTKGN